MAQTEGDKPKENLEQWELGQLSLCWGMGLCGLRGPLQASPILGSAGFAEAENRWSWG